MLILAPVLASSGLLDDDFIKGCCNGGDWRETFFVEPNMDGLRIGSSMLTRTAAALGAELIDSKVDDVLFVLTEPRAVPLDAAEGGCPDTSVLLLAAGRLLLYTLEFRDDDPPEAEDHASDDVGGGGKLLAITVACRA
jgi:hypothetical protein